MLALAGCAARRAPRPTVAVLPIDGIGVAPATASAIRSAIAHRLFETGLLEIVARSRVDRATARGRECQPKGSTAHPDCALTAARLAGASDAVAGSVGGIGSTRIVLLRRVNVPTRTERGVLERTYSGPDDALPDQAAALALKLFARETPRPPPRWYRRWWWWGAAGAALAATVAVVAVAAGGSDDTPAIVAPLP